jgi:hypothetical protein
MKEDEFELSREVLNSRRRQLVVEFGKGNTPNANVVAPNIEVSYKKRRRIIQSDDENE